jgi:hypothetical protein
VSFRIALSDLEKVSWPDTGKIGEYTKSRRPVVKTNSVRCWGLRRDR